MQEQEEKNESATAANPRVAANKLRAEAAAKNTALSWKIAAAGVSASGKFLTNCFPLERLLGCIIMAQLPR